MQPGHQERIVILPIATLDNRKREALVMLNAVYSSATPNGTDQANADKEARRGDAIRQHGLLSRMHPQRQKILTAGALAGLLVE